LTGCKSESIKGGASADAPPELIENLFQEELSQPPLVSPFFAARGPASCHLFLLRFRENRMLDQWGALGYNKNKCRRKSKVQIQSDEGCSKEALPAARLRRKTTAQSGGVFYV
jgi:hypothetical protein